MGKGCCWDGHGGYVLLLVLALGWLHVVNLKLGT